MEEDYRKELRKSKLIVVKVGSSSLSDKEGFLDIKKIEKLCSEIVNLKNRDIDVILVSSGAIRAGRALIKSKNKSSTMPSLQALAAVGQVILMEAYRKIMEQRKHIVAQILLTWDDFKNKRRLRNLLNTLNTLLSFGVIPIINENDTVAVDEIKFGDNDTLSALVAKYMQADLLIILSDVDGLYSGDPSDKNSRFISFVNEITPEIEKYAQNKYEGFGGMTTKIKAAKIVMEAGIPMIIANSSIDNVLERIILGEKIGTIFVPKVGL